MPTPTVQNRDDVQIEVAFAGICRTDFYVAQGRIESRNPVILGHEFAGRVTAAGGAVDRVAVGDRVTAMPIEHTADGPLRLGIERHGAFAQTIVVREHQVYRLPDGVSMQHGAYTEPMAAALAVETTELKPPILLEGANRIATLVERVLKRSGWTVERGTVEAGLPSARYNTAIETTANLAPLVESLCDEGVLILKSRPAAPVELPLAQAVAKRLRFEAVEYGSVDDALSCLADSAFPLDDLMGDIHPLDAGMDALDRAEQSPARKHFFEIPQD